MKYRPFLVVAWLLFLAFAIDLYAQDLPIHQRAEISVGGTLQYPVLPPAGQFKFDSWRINTSLTIKSDPTRPAFDGIPKWNLGFRAERQFSARLRLGGMASATRGESGPAFLSQELATGRDLSSDGSLTGPGTYQTVFNTAFTVTVPLKDTGHVNLKAVGEWWNPFFASKSPAFRSDTLLNGRTLRIGLLTTF